MSNNSTQNITLKPTTQLYHLYPDIQEQLCSRHSTLFGKLKQTFNKLYDNMQPSNYIVVKGNCQFVEETFSEISLSMGLENGIICMVSKTYSMSEIFVNSNHFSEELIFSHKGNIEQGLHQWVEQMQKVIKVAVSNLSSQELHGGIFYLHGNIPEGGFNYKQCCLISLYLSIMVINQNLQNVSVDRMIEDLSSLEFVGKREEIQRLFREYRNRLFNLALPDISSAKGQLEEINVEEEQNVMEMNDQEEEKQKQTGKQNLAHRYFVTKNKNSNDLIHHHNQNHTHNPKSKQNHKTFLNIPMPKQYKLLFCQLDLAKDDVQYELHRRQQLMKRKQQLINELKQKYHINGLFELFHKVEGELDLLNLEFQSVHEKLYQPKSMEDLECLQEEQILHKPNTFLQNLISQTKLVSKFTNQKLTLEQLIDSIWQINSKNLKLHSSQVVELVEDMKQLLQIKGCMIVNRNFLLIVVHKNRFTELLCQVKHKMNRGELKSKSLFKIEDDDLVQQRWSTDKAIGEKIFSSAPAVGVGIFDPSEAIWFD